MAAETGIPSVYLEHQLSHGRAAKKTQGSLIEKLRNKNSHSHSWTDSIKSVRSSVAERRTQVESTEPSLVQHCLDTLQKAMKVKSQQTLKERLDLIGRHLGLNTEIQDQKVSLGTDAFQVDVLLSDGGTITNVKLANQGDVVDCPDLKDILKNGDFPEFIEHLQGLQSIYQVTNDEKLKAKAFLALQALEKDLNQLAQFQSSISGVANYIHKCPLGIMLPRLAGKPMKLIYFVSPYDLLDKKSLAAHPLTVEAITGNYLGHSVTVCIEPVPDCAPANKLQTMPLMNVNKTHDGKSLPSFSAVSKINSMMLPASFVLVLPQSIPVSTQVLQKIISQTNLEIHKEADVQSLRSLILETFSGGSIKDCRKLFVSLPDQQHIYFLDCLDGGTQDHLGVMVSRIPFTHPTHVPQILTLLRQQLLFNIVIGSCVRPGSRTESANNVVFEVTALSLQQLTIVFEHPAYDSMIRVDVDLSDITSLKCKVACTNSDQILCSDEAISRVFHRCMSIPIMLRWLIRKGRRQLDKLKEADLAAKRERLERAMLLKEMQQQQAKLQPTNRPPPQPPHPPPLPPPPSYSRHPSPVHLTQNILNSNGQAATVNSLLADNRDIMLDEFRYMAENNGKHMNDRLLMSSDSVHAHNPSLTTLLDDEQLSDVNDQKEVHDSPMLSRLLDDNTSVATTVIPMNCKPALVALAKRQRKRRSQSDFSGPASKHKVVDNDLTEHFGGSLDLDLGPGVLDHSLHNTHPVMRSMTPTHGSSGHHHHHPVLSRSANVVRSQNNVIDLTEDNSVGESSLKKLANSMDKHLIHKDVKAEQDLSMLLNETEAQSRIPNILHNSPSGSKNENASTSLEGILKGSGEVGRAKDFDPSDVSSVHTSTIYSKLSSLLLATSDSPSPHLSMLPQNSNPVYLSDKVGTDESFSVNAGKPISNSIFLQDVKPPPSSLPKGMCQSSGVDFPNDRKGITGIFEKFDISRQQKKVKIEVADNEMKPQAIEGKVSLRLRVGPLKQQNSIKSLMKSSTSEEETDSLYVKSNNTGTFDFKSDEDDDDHPLQFSSDRCVYSSSPTCLQISSSKHRQLNDYASVPKKSDKAKKKDRSSGNTAKRKKEKDESKREKKRKKSEHFIQDCVYRTVENDTKADFKLKIRVAKKPVTDKSDVLSDGKVPSYEITKKPLVSSNNKLLPSKEDSKELVQIISEIVKEKDSVNVESNSQKIATGKFSVPVHKPSPKSGSSKMPQGGGSNSKTDPKLVTKATIRLKPLTMPHSGSTVNIGHTASKTSNTASASNKTERHGSTAVSTPALDKRTTVHNSLERRSSTSNLLERRSATQSSLSSALSSSTSALTTTTTATTPTTTTTANLLLSSILPNAPSISKKLPRIPKLSSSSSSTSISRTSSLDPASGSSPTSVGTKSNNSYTVGPAGRPNLGTTSGSGASRSAGSTAAFNYGSRQTAAGNVGSGTNWPNFNANRPGSVHRVTSPLVNSGHSGTQRPTDPRTQNTSVGNSHKTGIHSVNSHKHLGNFTHNSVKASMGSSNSPQKTFISGVKTNNSISSKVGNQLVGHKVNMSNVNSVSGQRHSSQNSFSGNNVRTGGSSCNVSRSPNTSGLTKSPNSGRSPNITNSGRSPNLNSANKSPSISSANKSPNISSSSSGKSPNVHLNRSHNVSNISVRSGSNNSSSKSAVPISHKHLPSVTKASSVNKTIVKSHYSSSSQRSSKNVSGSIDSPPAKPGTKTTSVISNNRQIGDSHPGSFPTAHASPITRAPGDNNSINSSAPSIVESTCIIQKSSPKQAQITPVSPPIPSPLSAVNTNSFNQTEPVRSSRSSAAAFEASQPPLPDKLSNLSSPCSTDGLKSKFSLPLSRGRKSSLSAIVDKLKYNAVGAVVDSPGLLGTFVEGETSMSSRAFLVPEDVKSDIKSKSLRQEERTSSSQLSPDSVEPTVDVENVGRKSNHGNHMKPVCKDRGGNTSSPVNFSSVKSLHSETENGRKGDIFSIEMSCDRTKKIEDISHNVYKIAETKDVFGRTKLKDDSVREECLVDVADINSHISKDKLVPLKQHLQQQTLTSSVQESAVSKYTTPTSPLVSLFQPPHSPDYNKSSSPAKVPGDRVTKGVKECDDQVCRATEIKPSLDFLGEESKTIAVASDNSELRNSKLCSENRCPRDNKVSQSIENRTTLKQLSSPLSDISSPENGLIIDDEESPKVSLKASNKTKDSDHVTISQSPKLSREDAASNVSQSPMDKANSIPNTLNYLPLASSPNASRPPSAKSPVLARNASGGSTPKESDSPFSIDDDLMDMALGFGS